MRVVFDQGVWRVVVPNYVMVSGTFLPVIPGKTHKDGVLPTTDPADPALAALTVEVEAPEDEVDETGKIILDVVAQRYPTWVARHGGGLDPA